MAYHALISNVGNWDYVADDNNLDQQIDGRTHIGTFTTPEAAHQAIYEYRAEEHANDVLVEQVTNPDIQPPIR
jgi:hypothetical protein